MLHPDDRPGVVTVRPCLEPAEVEVLAGLAGVGEVPRRLWPGQPGPRSPWLVCADGCCLVPAERRSGDAAEWLRFLVREVLAPTARDRVARVQHLGLPGGHRLVGRVVVDGGRRQLVVSGRQVRVSAARRGGGEGGGGAGGSSGDN